MKRIELLNRIQEIYTKLENNSLESNEIDELVELSNQLYERALILRYKVAEQRIFGENREQSTNEIADNTDDLSEVNISEPQISEAIDFSIFESHEEKVLENEAEAVNFEPEFEPVETELNFADSVDLKVEEVHIEPEMIIEPEPEIVVAEPVKVEEPIIVEKEIVVVDEILEEKPQNSSQTSNWDSFISKIIADHSTGIQKPLESLAGSFGLNERILYINELFNGEAEKFSNTILSLDKIQDWNSCKSALGQIAKQENWETESDTVGDFVLHVNRKHA